MKNPNEWVGYIRGQELWAYVGNTIKSKPFNLPSPPPPHHHHREGNKGPYISEDKRYRQYNHVLLFGNKQHMIEKTRGVEGKRGRIGIHGEVDCRVAECHGSRIFVKKVAKSRKLGIIGGFSVFSWCQRVDILHQ